MIILNFVFVFVFVEDYFMATNFNTNFNLNALSFCSYLFLFFLYYKYLISTKIQKHKNINTNDNFPREKLKNFYVSSIKICGLLCLILHSYALQKMMFIQGELHFSVSIAFSLIMLLAMLLYYVENLKYTTLQSLQILILPLVLLSILSTIIFTSTKIITAYTNYSGFYLHFFSVMLAYSFLTLAAIHAVFMNFISTDLKINLNNNTFENQQLKALLFKNLPPLLTLEKILFDTILIGFVCLSFGLITGLFFSEELLGQPMNFNHKTIFGIISWITFGVLLLGRYIKGWRGKVAMKLTLTGFTFLILAYLGTHFVLEVILKK